MSDRVGLLLVNLGTPEAPETGAVRRYLREFLSDRRVLDVPAFRRFLLLEFLILPRRPRVSAAAYRKIWTADGSPLLVHGRALAAGVQARLGEAVAVELAMRYGRPTIAAALAGFENAGITRIVLLPLYPQNSSAATGSTVARVFELAGRRWNTPTLQVVPPFFAHPAYLDARADSIRPFLVDGPPERVFLSFHGLPERQVRRSGRSGRLCLEKADCCADLRHENRSCYRAQCHETARQLGARLQIPPDRLVVCFQSRLGRTPWIRPYTDEVLADAARSGVRNALIVPSFVADCLETLEELGMRAVEEWRAHGGESLCVVPALNANERWIEALIEIARDGSSFLRSRLDS